jgi:pimeloyl-ACP methyl ester carboxylesterase
MPPTIVLVHGAYADSASWDGVARRLLGDGRVIAFANPLRGVASDAALLTNLIRSIDGPVVLVGHSYGGAVMTAVESDAGDIVALVYVAGFALIPGESAGDASALSGAHHIMAERAGARRTVEIPGASHIVGISHPDQVAGLVLEAVAGRAAVAS